MKVVFSDIDQVVRVAQNDDGTNEQFIPQLVRNLARLLTVSGAKLVISSDWRFKMSPEEVLSHMSEISPEKLHLHQLPDWIKQRRFAIQWWIDRHPGVTEWVVLDDRASLFDNAPPRIIEHVILCNGRVGLTGERVAAALRVLGVGVEHERTQFTGGSPENDADL